MKKMMSVFLALLMALLPLWALAADSIENIVIPDTRVVEVDAIDPTEPVVPPTVEIVRDTEPVAELQEELQTLYRLTIYYVYADGTTAAPTYDTFMQEGEAYSVPSPEIDGFFTATPLVNGVMPARNKQITVVYLSAETETAAFPYSEMTMLFDWTDYETPLGLGFSVMNVGICVE